MFENWCERILLSHRGEVLVPLECRRSAYQAARTWFWKCPRSVILFFCITLVLVPLGFAAWLLGLVNLGLLLARAEVHRTVFSVVIGGYMLLIMIPFVLPVLIGLRVTFAPHLRRAYREIGYVYCRQCGYALRGKSEDTRCPECGSAIR